MPRLERFTFVVDQRERAAIATLAKRLNRSQSDAVRVVVLEAARKLTGFSPVEKINLSQGANLESPTAA
jgi:hypothetical protein